MTVERLGPAHDIDNFSCGNEEARPVASPRGLDGRPGGYCSGGRGAPDTIPGFLLARLALAEDLHGGGRGGDLLALALEKILEAIAIGGGRLIVVDAIDEPAIAFYQHYGFRPTPADPARLVMMASTAAASLAIDWP